MSAADGFPTLPHRANRPANCGPRGRAGVPQMTVMTQAETVPTLQSAFGGSAPQGLELRHLRYFVAVADAGTFTHAAERMYIAQPTLSQQIRRLEEMVGTPLLRRKR